jgi:uncharacterized protein (TIGR03435 family)
MNRPPRRTRLLLSRATPLALVCAVAALSQAATAQNVAQAPNPAASYVPTLTFDVASIRESKPDPNAGFFMVGGGFTGQSSMLRLSNFDLRNLLNLAYAGEFDEVSGFPPQFDRTLFNIEAKSDSAADTRLATLNKDQARTEQQHMVQALLANRFNLKVHIETQQGKDYDLLLIKKGRLKETDGALPSPEELKAWGDHPVPPLYQKGSSKTGFEYIAHAASMGDISQMLAIQFGHPVVDKTGLTGRYDFDLKYYETRIRDRRDDDTNPWPPLDTAIEDQLGLRLQASTGPVRVLVIDHIETPSDN